MAYAFDGVDGLLLGGVGPLLGHVEVLTDHVGQGVHI